MIPQDKIDVGLALFLGGLMLIGLIAMIGGFLHYRRERLLTHTERMKALELGRELPDDAYTTRLKAIFGSTDQPEEAPGGIKSLASQCYSTTGWVSGCGFLFAMMGSSNQGVAYAVAAAAGAVGVTGLICGTILASRAPDPAPTRVASKPRFDPEAI